MCQPFNEGLREEESDRAPLKGSCVCLPTVNSVGLLSAVHVEPLLPLVNFPRHDPSFSSHRPDCGQDLRPFRHFADFDDLPVPPVCVCGHFFHHCLDELFLVRLLHGFVQVHYVGVGAGGECNRIGHVSLDLIFLGAVEYVVFVVVSGASFAAWRFVDCKVSRRSFSLLCLALDEAPRRFVSS